jgi:hypothetical protein
MFLLVVYNDQKKHGQTIQRPKETWTDNTTTKRNMDRQNNYQKKHGQAIQLQKSMFLLVAVLPVNVSCMFLLVVVLSVHVSFGRYIACP